MSVGVYYSTLCKNRVMFFEKFEQTNLIFILAQLGVFYYIPNYLCSSDHKLSPACSTPYQTLKYRRVDSLEDFKCMQTCPFPPAQN